MAVQRPRRVFAIERTMQRQAAAQELGLALPAPSAEPNVPTGNGGPDSGLIGQLLIEVKELRRELAALKSEKNGESDAPRPTIDPDESQLLRIEIAGMIRSLAMAKREIAEIKHPMADEDRVQRATFELDAIVGATERATHRILDASERININCDKVFSLIGDDEMLSPLINNIATEVFTIIEACNFQDITGQRIYRVVKTLEFIEDRIKKIIETWGVSAFADLPLPQTDVVVHTTDALVDGPQLESAALSQADIDALFG
ncbi:hypothetical protein [Pararhodospirillum oryzae]|uniref:Chemotaxis protein CheZ n=1 Tax=Pararhodospirillum oryzae TaxID=478448 RepID=A0A512HC19_9PROT|nr:hypothetical protein [Pararhodospirillum oryzae]GEO82997.1 hypothetical protein ROR02_31280 [Pararhodospirillum oryzae]